MFRVLSLKVRAPVVTSFHFITIVICVRYVTQTQPGILFIALNTCLSAPSRSPFYLFLNSDTERKRCNKRHPNWAQMGSIMGAQIAPQKAPELGTGVETCTQFAFHRPCTPRHARVRAHGNVFPTTSAQPKNIFRIFIWISR